MYQMQKKYGQACGQAEKKFKGAQQSREPSTKVLVISSGADPV